MKKDGHSRVLTAIYIRLSKEDRLQKDPAESIKNQKLLLTAYAIQQDWEIFDYYIDEFFKGSDRDRPEFNRLLLDAEQGRFSVVLCKSQARFCRDLELIEKYLHGKFLEWNIRFLSVVDHSDTEDRANKKSRQITGLKDQWYLEDLSEDICKVLTAKRQSGVHIGSWALYGYRKDPDRKGHLIVDPDAAQVVRYIYELYLEGWGAARIAKKLNDLKIDNPYTYKLKKGIPFNQSHLTPKAKYWSCGSVYTILKNRTYTGDLVQGRMKKVSYKSKKLVRVPEEDWIVAEKAHEPIVSAETFRRVQALMQSKGRAASGGSRHLFAGKVRCGECGQAMVAGRYSKKGGTPNNKEYVPYLRCSSRLACKEECIGSTILLSVLEECVRKEMNLLGEEYFSTEEIAPLVRFEDGVQEESNHLKKRITALERSLNEGTLALKNLYQDKVSGVISQDEFLILKDALSRDLAQSREERGILLVKRRVLLDKLEKQESVQEIVERHSKIETLTPILVNEFIDAIYVGHKNKDTGERLIKIIWTI